MITDNVGQLVFNEDDVCDMLMRGQDIGGIKRMLVDATVDTTAIRELLDAVPNFIKYEETTDSVSEFDARQQSNWHMPQEYKDVDIAEYVLSLCENEAELQRCGEELLLFQKFGLFNLLCYLNFLVNTMRQNNIIWGVGRGSSVASFVLYKLGVHRVNSLYYDLDPTEFLR